MIDAQALLEIAPHLSKTHLPAVSRNVDNMQEREILYKLLFDMRSDMQDLKQLVFELIRGNNLRVPETVQLRSYNPSAPVTEFTSPIPGQQPMPVIYMLVRK